LDLDAKDAEETKKIFQKVYQRYGIRVIVGNQLGIYTDPNDKAAVKANVKNMVKTYGMEPWVLSWDLGNENNFFTKEGEFYSDNQYWRSQGEDPDQYPMIEMTDKEYYEFVNELAQAVKETEEEMGIKHPVMLGVGVGERSFTDEDAECISNMEYVDIVGFNVYFGFVGENKNYSEEEIEKFQTVLVDRWAEKMGKWIIITEFGRSTSVKGGEKSQAEYNKKVWKILFRNMAGEEGSGCVLGGMLFEWGAEDFQLDAEKTGEHHFGVWSNPALRNIFTEEYEEKAPVEELTIEHLKKQGFDVSELSSFKKADNGNIEITYTDNSKAVYTVNNSLVWLIDKDNNIYEVIYNEKNDTLIIKKERPVFEWALTYSNTEQKITDFYTKDGFSDLTPIPEKLLTNRTSGKKFLDAIAVMKIGELTDDVLKELGFEDLFKIESFYWTDDGNIAVIYRYGINKPIVAEYTTDYSLRNLTDENGRPCNVSYNKEKDLSIIEEPTSKWKLTYNNTEKKITKFSIRGYDLTERISEEDLIAYSAVDILRQASILYFRLNDKVPAPPLPTPIPIPVPPGALTKEYLKELGFDPDELLFGEKMKDGNIKVTYADKSKAIYTVNNTLVSLIDKDGNMY
jgi:hypothetical protein